MPGTFIESHRYPQRALLQDLVLPDGTALPQVEWEDNCCGPACVQSIQDANGLPVPTLDTLFAKEIESGSYDVAKGSTRSPRCSYSLCILQLTATWSYFVALGRLAQKVKSAAAMILQPREPLSMKWNGLDCGQVSPVVHSS